MKKLILAFTLLIISNSIPQVTFQDVALSMGLFHPFQGADGGISFCDFNKDGKDDISFNNSNGGPVFLFRNDFTNFTNVQPSSGISDTLRSTLTFWVDYDNDGDRDLFVGRYFANNLLYRNDGNFNFTDVSLSSGLSPDSMTTSAACWGDYNNDGWLDLYVTNYSEYQPNYLYKNNGDGTFADVTIQANVQDTLGGTSFYKTPLAVAFLDFNNDGYTDIFTANDHQTGNSLFKNLGDGTFADITETSGTGTKGSFMGVGIGDYDNNGFFDIYVSNDPTGNHLLKNNGDETFTDVTTQLGVAVNQVCWGANFFDFDNDSDMDLYVSVLVGSPNNNNVLFENQGDGTFSQVTGIGFDENYESYGNAIGDFDNKGYCDVAVLNTNGNMNLYQSSGGTNNWVKIILNGISTNKDGVGSKIEYYLGSDRYVRYIHCGISFASQSSSSQILGIGNASSIDSIIIYWTSSLVDKFYDVAPNQILLIEEGETIVPVELTSFTAQANNNEVVLNWSTATEINNSGFEINRIKLFSPPSSLGNMNWNVIGFVPGFGTTTEPKSYSFTDEDISESNYQYRLKQIDFDGSYEYSNIVEVSILKADNFELEQNYPNPFNPATTISFNLQNDSQVSLIIFDVLGQQVTQLINRELEAGRHSINFDASSLRSGVYFYKLRIKNQSGTFFEAVKKMIFNK